MMDEKTKRQFLEENAPPGYALLAIPEEDIRDLVSSLAAAKAMFVTTKTKETPAGLTEAKIDRLSAMLIGTMEAPAMAVTTIPHRGRGEVH